MIRLLIAMLLLFCTCSAIAGEKLVNGNFEADPPLAGWVTNKWGGEGEIAVSRDGADPISGIYSAKVQVIGVDDPERPGSEWWHLNFLQTFASPNSKQYFSASFRIRASEPMRLHFQLVDLDRGAAITVHEAQVDQSTQMIRISGTSPVASRRVGLAFYFGRARRGTSVWIDDASMNAIDPVSSTARVTVDFSRREQSSNLAGLLLGLDYDFLPTGNLTRPAASLVNPLHAKHWRVPANARYINRVLGFGSVPIVLPEIQWLAGATPGNPNAPWADGYARYDQALDDLVRNYGDRVYYEVWNEPDLPEFFGNFSGGTFEKYLEVFKHVHNKIRSIAPNALIGGPSLSVSFDWVRLRQFMEFCRGESLRCDFISLHVWNSDDELESAAEDLVRVREMFIDNPRYANTGISKIIVTEYLGNSAQRMRPGSILAMQRLLEVGRADGATTSCWYHFGECPSTSSCWDGSLGGLLTCDATNPRSAWWAHRWYSLGANQRVGASSDNPGVVVLGSGGGLPNSSPQVLLAARGYGGDAKGIERIEVELLNLGSAGGVNGASGDIRYWVERISFAGDGTAATPLPDRLVNGERAVVANDATAITINDVGAYDALRISFAEPPVGISAPMDEPKVRNFGLPTPISPNANCPSGFFSALVDDGPDSGLTTGAFGMEVLLDEPGTRVLAGGLNFGGLIDLGQVGFAAFNIANTANEPQRLNVSLSGSPASSSSGSLAVRVRIARRTATTSETVFDRIQTISLTAPFATSIDLPPAFYEATVAPVSGDVGGAAEGQFYFSLTTSFVNRAGGGFQGGAVVGGYHAVHPFGGVSGFAAFCLATPHRSSIRVLSRPTYGPSGAKDLRLRIQDAQQRDLVVVPSG